MKLSKIKHLIPKELKLFNNWYSNRQEYNHLKDILKNEKIKKTMDKTIVFNTIRCLKNIVDREFYIGKILALYGAQVYMLLDDGILKHWDTIQIESLKNVRDIKKFPLNPYQIKYRDFLLDFDKILKKNVMKKALKTFEERNLKIIYYSQILKNINYENWGILKKFARSSTIRFFKTPELDLENSVMKYYYHLSLKNAILSRNVGEYILNEIEPDIFCTSHGIYSTWGPAFEFLKENGIECRVYAGYHGHSPNPKQIYMSNDKLQLLTRSKFWQNFREQPLNQFKLDKVKEYFNQRLSYSTKDTQRIYKGKKNILKVFKNDGYKYHIAMFPHLIWDGNIEDRHQIFNGYLDWLFSTIEYLKNSNEIKLYVKAHPTELLQTKSTRVIDLIKKNLNFDDANNIIFIPPENKIDTYLFLRSGIDLGLVYDGFLGVELPYLKIPAITCVKGGNSSIEEGNYTASTREEYFSYLDNVDSLVDDFHSNFDKYYNNVVKYLYWYIFENGIDFPILSSKHRLGTDLLQLKREDLIFNKKLLSFFN